MRSSFTRACLLLAACSALGACAATTGAPDYAAASCSTPGAVRESPFNSTANPTEGPLPRAPGDFPCYLPENGSQPALASAGGSQPKYASSEAGAR